MINVLIISLIYFLGVRGFEEVVYEKSQLSVGLTGDNYVAVLGLGDIIKALDFDHRGRVYRSEETSKNQGIFVLDDENKVVSGEFYHTYTFENEVVGAKSDIFVENGYYVRRITDDHSHWEDVDDVDEEEIDTTWWHGENGVSSRRSLSGDIEYTIKWYYSSAALREAGSLEALETEVLKGNAGSNIVYANSGLNLKVSMAGDLTHWVQKTPIISSDWKTEWRDRLTAHQRDEGDIVALIIGKNEGYPNNCGLASTIPESSSEYSSSEAFFYIKVHCFSQYTQVHEVGHLQGLGHNAFSKHCKGTGCGNVIKCGDSQNGGRRTIMSYPSGPFIDRGFAKPGFPCTKATAGWELRVPYFSSPDVQIMINGHSYITGHSKANSVKTVELSMKHIPTYATNYFYVPDHTCEAYGYATITTEEDCRAAANLLKKDQWTNFINRLSYGGGGRPKGCSFHKFGNVELWRSENLSDCDVHGFSGCFCKGADRYTLTAGLCRGGNNYHNPSSGECVGEHCLYNCLHGVYTNRQCRAACDNDPKCYAYDRPIIHGGAQCCLFGTGNTGDGSIWSCYKRTGIDLV